MKQRKVVALYKHGLKLIYHGICKRNIIQRWINRQPKKQDNDKLNRYYEERYSDENIK